MDIVVTVPKNFTHQCAPGKRGLAAWIAEGDAAGDEWTEKTWNFTTWGTKPNIELGERVYIVCENRLRGYAPLVDMYFEPARDSRGYIDLVRAGGAVAVTIDEKIVGFRGWRKRWWDRVDEAPFPDWKGGG